MPRPTSITRSTKSPVSSAGFCPRHCRQLPGDLWLSLGFNRFGYSDDELTDGEWTREGGFMRLRAKFDESMFQRRREVRP